MTELSEALKGFLGRILKEGNFDPKIPDFGQVGTVKTLKWVLSERS